MKKLSPQDRHLTQEQQWEIDAFSIKEISAIGNTRLLETKKLGLLCSIRCPARIILKTYDHISSVKGRMTIVSGFHSPVERESLRILVAQGSPVIVCPVRSIDQFKVPESWYKSIESGKILVLSMFQKSYPRPDARLAYQRNKFVSILSDKVLIPFADKRSKTLELVRFMISKGKTVSAFDAAENSHLFSLGVKPL